MSVDRKSVLLRRSRAQAFLNHLQAPQALKDSAQKVLDLSDAILGMLDAQERKLRRKLAEAQTRLDVIHQMQAQENSSEDAELLKNLARSQVAEIVLRHKALQFAQ